MKVCTQHRVWPLGFSLALRQVVTLFSTLHQSQLSVNRLVQCPVKGASPCEDRPGLSLRPFCPKDAAAPTFAVGLTKRKRRRGEHRC